MTLAAAGRPLRFRVMHSSPRPNRWYRVLYVQVLIAVLLGVVVGYFWPEFGKSLKPLGDAFIKLEVPQTLSYDHADGIDLSLKVVAYKLSEDNC